MSTKKLIIPAVLLALVLVAAGASLVYDDGRPEQIARGITVGGIDVGGLHPSGARARLDRELVTALEQSIVVHHDKKTWRLRAREARVRTDVSRLVDDAVERTEQGGVLGRTHRRLTDGRVDANLEPTVTFSDRAVVRLVDRVRRSVERPAENARVLISAAGVDATPSRRGLRVEARALHRSINAALVSPTAERRFVATTRKLAPKVTTKTLMRKNAVVLIADRAGHTLRVYKQFKLAKTYGIAAGQAAYPTPAGDFTIVNKAVDPTWSVPTSTWAGSLAGQVIPGGAPNNPLKARWLGIVDGVGIHGTSERGSIGSNASHGCLRMQVEDVIDLYPQVPVGSRILIA